MRFSYWITHPNKKYPQFRGEIPSLLHISFYSSSTPRTGLFWIYHHSEQNLSQVNHPEHQEILLVLQNHFASFALNFQQHKDAQLTPGEHRNISWCKQSLPKTLGTTYQFEQLNKTHFKNPDQMLRLSSYSRWQQRYWVTEQSWAHFLHLQQGWSWNGTRQNPTENKSRSQELIPDVPRRVLLLLATSPAFHTGTPDVCTALLQGWLVSRLQHQRDKAEEYPGTGETADVKQMFALNCLLQRQPSN